MAQDDPNAITNPRLIFEVLSPSTAATDQSTKAAEYKTLPSLEAYVLVWQEEVRVQVHRRTAGGWIVSHYGAGDHVELDGIELVVRDLYPEV